MPSKRSRVVLFIVVLIQVGICLLTSIPQAYCQDDYEWWNEAVDWDGVTHWNDYLIDSPRYFGPNAMIIPEMTSAKIGARSEFSFGNEFHFTDGDHTHNIQFRWYIPFANKISFYGSLIPIEHYAMSANRRDERRSRDLDGRGYALGDLIVGTQIQIIHTHSVIPDLVFRSQFKTALGTQRSAARYLDAPGYSFDLILGKSTNLNELEVRPVAMLGLYVWQTNEDKNPQNDAVLLGAGLQFKKGNIEWLLDYSSYHGYKNNGDHSAAIRNKLSCVVSLYTSIDLSYHYGVYDNLYQTIKAAIRVRL